MTRKTDASSTGASSKSPATSASAKDVASPAQNHSRGSLGANIRNLDWFLATFTSFASTLEPHVGNRLEVSEEKLRLVFFDWIELFESNEVKDYARRNYWDCVDYIAGMGLTGLISHQPLTLDSREFVRKQAEPAALVRLLGIRAGNVEQIPQIIEFWPEGFVYVSFCLSCIKQLRQQKGQARPVVNDDAFGELRFWWAFRENALEDNTTVLYYLDQILGNNPAFSGSNSLNLRITSMENPRRIGLDTGPLKS
jgi:hypothetical protein